MEFLELIRARYSVRAYRDKPVEDDKLAKVLEAARLAPSAANRQPVRIVVIHTHGREAELKRIYHREWFTQAPLVVGVCAALDEAWVRDQDKKSYHDVDAAIVMDHLILAAADQGLGTCWVGAFDPGAAREVLNLPANIEPVVFTPLGYPATEPGAKHRKSLDDLVHYERFTHGR
jgi:nitroreductase